MKYIKIILLGPFVMLYICFLYGVVFTPPIILILIFGYQCYLYLMDGLWTSFSLLQFVAIFDHSLYDEPESWVGVWKILDRIPFTLALLILSYYTVSGLEGVIKEVKLMKEKYLA